MELQPFMWRLNLLVVARVSVLVLGASLSACVVAPPERVVHERPAMPVQQDIVVYPNNGQTEAQTDRDRYECHQWAVKQSHFEPSLASDRETPHIRVVTEPPGVDTAAGAITGALLGAAVSNPRSAPGGALIGAVAGAMIGAASDNARQQQAAEAQQQYDERYLQSARPAQVYRRAITACLEGRGYVVK